MDIDDEKKGEAQRKGKAQVLTSCCPKAYLISTDYVRIFGTGIDY